MKLQNPASSASHKSSNSSRADADFIRFISPSSAIRTPGERPKKRVIPAHYLAAKSCGRSEISPPPQFRLVVQAAASPRAPSSAQLACDTLAHLRRRCVRKRRDKHQSARRPHFSMMRTTRFARTLVLPLPRCRGTQVRSLSVFRPPLPVFPLNSRFSPHRSSRIPAYCRCGLCPLIPLRCLPPCRANPPGLLVQ